MATPILEPFINRFHGEDVHGGDIDGVLYEYQHKHIYTPAGLVEAMQFTDYDKIKLSDYRDPYFPLGHHDAHADRYSARQK